MFYKHKDRRQQGLNICGVDVHKEWMNNVPTLPLLGLLSFPRQFPADGVRYNSLPFICPKLLLKISRNPFQF